jgi:protein regulator of cytokinesis 1
MELSPDSLFELKIVPEVQTLWDELGLEESERSAAIESLSKELAQVYSHFRDSLLARCAEVRREIASVNDKHRRAKQAFGVPDADIRHQIPPIAPTNLLHQLLQAKQSLGNFQVLIANRIQKLENLVHMAGDLFDAIGTPPDERGEFGEVGNTDFTRERIERFRSQIALLHKEREDRLTRRTLVKSDVSALLTDLNSIAEGDDLAVLNSESLSLDQIDRLCVLRDKLEQKIKERTNEVSALAVTITHLWDLLAIDEAERVAFLCSHTSLGDDVMASCQEEITRLTRLRDAKLPELVAAQRAGVRELWELMHIAAESRPRFAPGSRDAVEEFNFLQQEIIRLKNLLVEFRPIMEAVNQREEIVKEYNDMLRQMQDPNRLMSRGRGRAQQRMREEKARRRYHVSLPKLEKKLYKLLAEYRSKTGTDFEWDGKPYVDTLTRAQGKEKAKSLPSAQSRVAFGTSENDDPRQKAAWLVRKQPA